MLVPQPNLEFLTTILVFLGPFRVVFPICGVNSKSFPSRYKIERKLYFMISLSLMTRLISLIIRELTHTSFTSQVRRCHYHRVEGKRLPTFFPNQGVIAVVRVVGVTCHCAAAIAQNTEIEFCRDRYMSANFKQNRPGSGRREYRETRGRSGRNGQSSNAGRTARCWQSSLGR